MPSGAAGLELCGKRVWVTGHNGIVGSTLLRRFVRQDTGAGSDIAIADLATLIAEIVGYEGGFSFATSRPNGTSRKLLDITRTAAFGWGPTIGLADGIRATYQHRLAVEAADAALLGAFGGLDPATSGACDLRPRGRFG